jgi:hypothetical protein
MTMFLKIIFALVEVELFITMGYCHSTGTELFHTDNNTQIIQAKETTVETVRSQIHCGISCASKNDCCSAIFEPNLMNCYQHPHCLADKEPGDGTRMFKSPGKFEC